MSDDSGVVTREALGIGAIVWMLAIVVILAAQAYTAFDIGFGGGGFGNTIWLKMTYLGQLTGAIYPATAAVGLGMAAFSRTPRARVAYWLGALIGVWAALVGFGSLAAAVHGFGDDINPFVDNRVVQGFASLAYATLGFVVAMIAFVLATSSTRPVATAPVPRPDGPELVELS